MQVHGQSPAGTGVLREAVGGSPRAGRRGRGEGAGLRGAGHPAQPAGELRAGPVLSGAPAQHRSLSGGKVHAARLPIWQEVVFVKCISETVIIPRFMWQDKSLEAEASDALGGVYQLMADNETALQVCALLLFISICPVSAA